MHTCTCRYLELGTCRMYLRLPVSTRRLHCLIRGSASGQVIGVRGRERLRMGCTGAGDDVQPDGLLLMCNVRGTSRAVHIATCICAHVKLYIHPYLRYVRVYV